MGPERCRACFARWAWRVPLDGPQARWPIEQDMFRVVGIRTCPVIMEYQLPSEDASRNRVLTMPRSVRPSPTWDFAGDRAESGEEAQHGCGRRELRNVFAPAGARCGITFFRGSSAVLEVCTVELSASD